MNYVGDRGINKPKPVQFAHWFFYESLPEPLAMFTVAMNGSTMCLSQLKRVYGIDPGIYPTFAEWKRQVRLKQRCARCYRATRGYRGLMHHYSTNITCGIWYKQSGRTLLTEI